MDEQEFADTLAQERIEAVQDFVGDLPPVPNGVTRLEIEIFYDDGARGSVHASVEPDVATPEKTWKLRLADWLSATTSRL